MSFRKTGVALILAAAALTLVITTSGQSVAPSVSPVQVTNFPATQIIEGEVSISGSVRLSEIVRFNDILVPPVNPRDTTRLVEAGTLVAGGYSDVVLSLHGQVKGSVKNVGEVGALLVPDERTIQLALNEQGMVHFALRVASTQVSTLTPYFSSDQPRYTVGFETYKVLLYNTTDKTVTVNLYAYLSS